LFILEYVILVVRVGLALTGGLSPPPGCVTTATDRRRAATASGSGRVRRHVASSGGPDAGSQPGCWQAEQFFNLKFKFQVVWNSE
jgi:hypothetical protein